MDPLTALLIIAAIYLLIYIIAQAIGIEKLNEKGIDAGFPFFILIKTERLNAFLTKWGKRFPKAFFNVGVVVAFGGMIFGFYMFLDNLLKFFFAPAEAGGVVPIIPGVTISGLPLVYLLIGLGVTLLTHEFAHGLAASRDDIPIKSSGLLFFYVLFGGFVEPDEEAFENQATPRQRMRLLAAGSYVNLIWGFIFLILIANFGALMSVGFNSPSGAYIYDIVADSPGSEALEIGDVITGLNETTIDSWYAVSLYMVNASSGDSVTIHTLDGSADVILAANTANASRGYIGVYGADYWEPKPGWEWIPGGPMYAFHAQQILNWIFIILFSIGLINLLPIPMFDGDKLLSNGLSLLTDDEKKIKMVMWPARLISIGIILLSIILSLVMGKALF
ncbi:MAG: site-2 protease family protein [Candidatus Thorarchaeota archaeon]